jgi:hypothetical protein
MGGTEAYGPREQRAYGPREQRAYGPREQRVNLFKRAVRNIVMYDLTHNIIISFNLLHDTFFDYQSSRSGHERRWAMDVSITCSESTVRRLDSNTPVLSPK